MSLWDSFYEYQQHTIILKNKSEFKYPLLSGYWVCILIYLSFYLCANFSQFHQLSSDICVNWDHKFPSSITLGPKFHNIHGLVGSAVAQW